MRQKYSTSIIPAKGLKEKNKKYSGNPRREYIFQQEIDQRNSLEKLVKRDYYGIPVGKVEEDYSGIKCWWGEGKKG